MFSEYCSGLAKQGIRRFETYKAEVTNELLRGCYIRVSGVDRLIYMTGQYPVGTKLYISFDIRRARGEIIPVVEWVEEYGSFCLEEEKHIA